MGLGVYVVCIIAYGYIYVLTLNMLVSLESFGGLFTRLAHSSKVVHCRVKRIKIWASGLYVVSIWVLFDFEPVKVIWGHSVHFSHSTSLTCVYQFCAELRMPFVSSTEEVITYTRPGNLTGTN